MNDLQTFHYQAHAVRTIRMNGEPWFILKDVCETLGLASPHKVADRLDDDERTQIPVIDSMGRPQETTIINESGLYNVILRSDKPEARPFRKWVTSEVLPSIRKTGCYGTPNLSELSPELRCLIRLEQQQKQQAQEIVRLNQKLDQLQGTRALATGGWRRESIDIISRIAHARGGGQYVLNTYQAAYARLEEREHCSLTDRLKEFRIEQCRQGMSKARTDRLTKLDVIAASPESVERWLKILHEMEARYCTATPEKE